MKYPIRCESINQFKVLEYLDKYFELDQVQLDLVDKDSIRLTDKTGKSSVFSTDGDSIFIDNKKI